MGFIKEILNATAGGQIISSPEGCLLRRRQLLNGLVKDRIRGDTLDQRLNREKSVLAVGLQRRGRGQPPIGRYLDATSM
jgi:hypothetical protein